MRSPLTVIPSFLLATLFVSAYAFPAVDKTALLGTAENNAYLDNVLMNLAFSMSANGYDPYDIPDQVFEFDFIITSGTLGLVDGHIGGLSRLDRVGDTTVVVDGNGDIFLSSDLEITHLTGEITLVVDALGIDISPTAKMTIANSDISFIAKADPDELILQLTELDLSHVGNITIDIEGLGSWDILLELLVSFISTFVKDFMADVIQGPVRLLFNQILLDFPIETPTP